LLIALDDRKVRIEVGYGLEGALPDALASSIIRNEIAPFFRQGKYYQGILAGLSAINAATQGEYVNDDRNRRRQDNEDDGVGFPFIYIIIFILIALFSRGRGGGLGTLLLLGALGWRSVPRWFRWRRKLWWRWIWRIQRRRRWIRWWWCQRRLVIILDQIYFN
jgi:uncharacterized membrane protein YgcG